MARGWHGMGKAVGLLLFLLQHPTTGQEYGSWPSLTPCEQAVCVYCFRRKSDLSTFSSCPALWHQRQACGTPSENRY